MMRLIGGILLVAGTTIGASMLALPLATAFIGFVPSLVLFAVVWSFMTYTAFLILEVNYAAGQHTNLITMARHTLGPLGEGVAWFSYLLLLYSLVAAYITGSGDVLIDVVQENTPYVLPEWVGPLPFVVFFGTFIYLGIRPVDYLNRLLMLGLFISYIVLVVLIAPHIRSSLLGFSSMRYIFSPLSVVVTAFGFHIIVPSLDDYLGRDIRKMKICLFVGSLLPLGVYVLWELLIMGTLPLQGEQGLLAMFVGGKPAGALPMALRAVTGSRLIGPISEAFSFFAIVTSFLGVSLSLSDFLADGFKVRETGWGRLGIVALAFLPPLLFAWVYPAGFIAALGYAGIFVAILLGILPAAMSWSLRYQLKEKIPYRVWGGKLNLVVVIAFFCFVILIHIFRHHPPIPSQ